MSLNPLQRNKVDMSVRPSPGHPPVSTLNGPGGVGHDGRGAEAFPTLRQAPGQEERHRKEPQGTFTPLSPSDPDLAPADPAILGTQERKYFDSGDYALSKAGKTAPQSVGTAIPSPENIPHASPPTNGVQPLAVSPTNTSPVK